MIHYQRNGRNNGEPFAFLGSTIINVYGHERPQKTMITIVVAVVVATKKKKKKRTTWRKKARMEN